MQARLCGSMCSPCSSQGAGLCCSAHKEGCSKGSRLSCYPGLYHSLDDATMSRATAPPFVFVSPTPAPPQPLAMYPIIWTTRALLMLPPPSFFHVISMVHPVCALVCSAGESPRSGFRSMAARAPGSPECSTTRGGDFCAVLAVALQTGPSVPT